MSRDSEKSFLVAAADSFIHTAFNQKRPWHAFSAAVLKAILLLLKHKVLQAPTIKVLASVWATCCCFLQVIIITNTWKIDIVRPQVNCHSVKISNVWITACEYASLQQTTHKKKKKPCTKSHLQFRSITAKEPHRTVLALNFCSASPGWTQVWALSRITTSGWSFTL